MSCENDVLTTITQAGLSDLLTRSGVPPIEVGVPSYYPAACCRAGVDDDSEHEISLVRKPFRPDSGYSWL